MTCANGHTHGHIDRNASLRDPSPYSVLTSAHHVSKCADIVNQTRLEIPSEPSALYFPQTMSSFSPCTLGLPLLRFRLHLNHTRHTTKLSKVRGTAVAGYIHHKSETTKTGIPGPFVDRAKKLVPKRLQTKVAGRWSIVRMAMVFMAALSRLVS